MLKCPSMYGQDLNDLRRKSLLRTVRDRGPRLPEQARIVAGGREAVNFASNDYLGLSTHPAMVGASIAATRAYGAGAGASRLLAGGGPEHRALEEAVRSFKGSEAALLFNSGYAANTGAIPALAQEGDAIFSDELNHASLIDGCRLSRAKRFVYRHRSVEHLGELLKPSRARRRIILTDSVFSMHGRIAPLGDIVELAKKYDALLYVDDAHGTGVLGGGRGALAHFGIKPEPFIIQMGTCSKALGSFGAFVAASSEVIEWLINAARPFIYSTALPPGVVAASRAALEIVAQGTPLVERLWENRQLLFEGFRGIGLATCQSETPIVPIACGGVEQAIELSRRLFDAGFYAPAIRPPTVPEPLIRFTVTAVHTDKDIRGVLDFLGDAAV